MHYFKVIKNNTAIDALNEIRRVFYSERSGAVLLCVDEDTEANGIIGSDSSIWHVDGWPAFPADLGIETVTLEEIDVVTYEKLLLALQRGEDDPEDTEPAPAEDGNTGEIMTRAELTAKVQEQDTVIADLREQLAAAKILLGVDE